MPKGSYPVSDTYVGPGKDGSFRSCMCAMLIFLAICGSILLIAHLLKNSKNNESHHSLGSSDQRKGNKHDPNEHQKTNDTDLIDEFQTKQNADQTGRIKQESSSTKPETTNPGDSKSQQSTVKPDQSNGKPIEKNIGITSSTKPETTNPGDSKLQQSTVKPDQSNGKPIEKNIGITSSTKPETTNPNDSKPQQSTVKPDQSNGKPTDKNIAITSSTKPETTKPDDSKSQQSTDKPDQSNGKPTDKNIAITSSTKPETTNPDDSKSQESTDKPDQSNGKPSDKNIAITSSTKPETTKPEDSKSQQSTVKPDQSNGKPTDKNIAIISSTKPETTNPDESKSQQSTNKPDQSNGKPTDENIAITSSTKPETTNPDDSKSQESTDKPDQSNGKPSDKNIAITSSTKPETTNPDESKSQQSTVKPDQSNGKPSDKNIAITSSTKPETTNPDDSKSQESTDNPDQSNGKPSDKNIAITSSTKPETTNPDDSKSQQSTDKPNQSSGTTTEKNKGLTTEPPKDVTTQIDKSIHVVNKDTSEKTGIVTTAQPVEKNKQEPGKGTESSKTETTTDPTYDITTVTDKKPVSKSSEPKTTVNIITPITIPTTKSVPEETDPPTTTEVATDNPDPTTTTPVPTTKPTSPATSTTVKHTPRPSIHETAEVSYNPMATPNPDIPRYCDTECMKSAARMVARLRPDVDVCEEFYDYACGGDYSDNTLEDHWKKIAAGMENLNDRSSKPNKKFKSFYQMCVDFQMDYDFQDRIDYARNLLNQMNQSMEAKDKKMALTVLLTQLVQIDNSPLFDISVDVDKSSQQFIFQLNIGKRFSTIINNNNARRKCLYQCKKDLKSHLNLNELYGVYLNCQKNKTYNSDAISETLEYLTNDTVYQDSHEEVTKIIDLLKTFTPAYIRQNIALKNVTYLKVSDLNFQYPKVDWTNLFSNLVGKKVNEESLVQIYFVDYFKNLFKLLAEIETTRTIPEVILEIFATDLYINYVLPTPVANPEEYCLKKSADLMPEVASSFYLDSFDGQDIENDQKRIEDLFNALKKNLVEMIPNITWTDVSTKNSLTKKTNEMKLELWNGSLVWKDDILLDERMELVKDSYSNYIDFLLDLNRRKQQMTFNMWNTFGYNRENMWWYFLKPYDTEPAIIYASNLVVVPPAMMFTKSKHLPRYWSLAQLGYKIGKAIGHHFDPVGSKYNISLDSSSLKCYKESEICNDNHLKLEDTDMKYDGKHITFKIPEDYLGPSRVDRYAEQISLQLISNILDDEKDDFNITMFPNSDLAKIFEPEKLFFIVLGQEHCKKPNLDDFMLSLFENEHLPSAVVLNKGLIHLKKFSEVFQCNAGSKINAQPKCAVFPNLENVYADYDYSLLNN